GLGAAGAGRRRDRLRGLDRQLDRAAPSLRGPLRGGSLRPHDLPRRQPRRPLRPAGGLAGLSARRLARPPLSSTATPLCRRIAGPSGFDSGAVNPHRRRGYLLTIWTPGLVLALVALLLVLLAGLFDTSRTEKYGSLLSLLTPDPAAAGAALVPVRTAAGVAIAIVIVVVVLGIQLTADRYSPRIIDIFVRDPLNGLVLAFFLGSIVFTIWVGAEIKTDYVPMTGVVVAILLAVFDFTILLPHV